MVLYFKNHFYDMKGRKY